MAEFRENIQDKFNNIEDQIGEINAQNFDEKISHDEKLVELRLTTGRVSNFTLHYFFVNFWAMTLIFVVVLTFFVLVYRRLRGDQKTFLQKLDDRSKGLKHKHQTRMTMVEELAVGLGESGMNKQGNRDTMETDYSKKTLDDNAKAWLGINAKETNPFGLLQLVDEVTMIRFMGRDLTIFLKFLRYQGVMFLVILLLQWTVLIPLYYFGDDADRYLVQEVTDDASGKETVTTYVPDDLDDPDKQVQQANITLSKKDAEYNMLRFTILNISTDKNKMTFAYIMVMVTSLIVYLQIFCFWKNTYSWKDRNFGHGEDAKFSNFHQYSILIRGIPKNLDPIDAGQHIKRILNRQPSCKGKIIDVKVVGDYKELYAMGEKWELLLKRIKVSSEYEHLLDQLERFAAMSDLEQADYLQKLDMQESKNIFDDIPLRERRGTKNKKRWTILGRESTRNPKLNLNHSSLLPTFNGIGGRPKSTSLHARAENIESPVPDMAQIDINSSTASRVRKPSALWKCWEFCCCERRVRGVHEWTNSERFQRNVRKAKGIKNRCCCRIKPEEQAAKTKKLRQEAEQMRKDIEKFKQLVGNKTMNMGCGFILTSDRKIVKDIIKHADPLFKDKWQKNMTFFEATKYQVQNWDAQESFHEEDIRWKDLNQDPVWQFKKYIICMVFLFVLSVLLITPLSVYTALYPIKRTMQNWGSVWSVLAENASPLIIALVNIGIIPCFVDVIAFILNNETKSNMQYEILKMNLTFMTLNMIFLPLSGLVSYEELLGFIKKEDFNPQDVINTIAGNMGNMASFFVIYLMQVTFLSNLIQLFDVPHLLYKSFFRLIFYIQQKQFMDDFYFQLGYYQSYTSTIMMMCLMFSIIMPVVTVFAVVFFFMRHYIEKYNFLFVYQQEYESFGRTRDYMIRYQVFSLVMFQLFNYSYIITGPEEMDIPRGTGYAFVGLQIFLLIVINQCLSRNKKFRKGCQRLCFLKGTNNIGRNDLIFKADKNELIKQKKREKQADELNEEQKKILMNSYEHPWHKLERQIDRVNYLENEIKNQHDEGDEMQFERSPRVQASPSPRRMRSQGRYPIALAKSTDLDCNYPPRNVDNSVDIASPPHIIPVSNLEKTTSKRQTRDMTGFGRQASNAIVGNQITKQEIARDSKTHVRRRTSIHQEMNKNQRTLPKRESSRQKKGKQSGSKVKNDGKYGEDQDTLDPKSKPNLIIDVDDADDDQSPLDGEDGKPPAIDVSQKTLEKSQNLSGRYPKVTVNVDTDEKVPAALNNSEIMEDTDVNRQSGFSHAVNNLENQNSNDLATPDIVARAFGLNNTPGEQNDNRY